MVSEARRRKCRERKKKRLAQQACAADYLRMRGGVKHVWDIARVSLNYKQIYAQELITECNGCHMGVAILPTFDQRNSIYVCNTCNQELC